MGFLTDLVDDLRRALDRQPLDDTALLARALYGMDGWLLLALVVRLGN